MDILFCSCEVKNTITKLQELRTNEFDDIWNVVVTKCGLPTRRKVRCNLQTELQYKTLFFEIIDTIVMQMKQKFKSVKDIEFVELLDCKRFHQYENITKFPERSFQSLQRSYSSHFDFACLRTERAVYIPITTFARTMCMSFISTCMKDSCMKVSVKLTN